MELGTVDEILKESSKGSYDKSLYFYSPPDDRFQ